MKRGVGNVEGGGGGVGSGEVSYKRKKELYGEKVVWELRVKSGEKR